MLGEQEVQLEPEKIRQIQKMLPNGDYIWVDLDPNEQYRTREVPVQRAAGAFVCDRCGIGFMAQFALAEHVMRDHQIVNNQRDMTLVKIPTGETGEDGEILYKERRAFEVPELNTTSKVAQDVAAVNEWKSKALKANEEADELRTQVEELSESVKAMGEHIASQAKEQVEKDKNPVMRGKKK
ncbi:hypothetical protein LCGC14_2759290 [marine sediment metagenome]|uniref:C2H2-type domain-containing protein n=1 Tax=marine sediment metagenome TaxID=412755 RepID=A0A0F8YZH6_9ZZZZ